LAGAGRAEHQHVASFAHELARRQVEDPILADRRIKAEVEVLHPTRLAEVGRRDAPVQEPLIAGQQFVLHE